MMNWEQHSPDFQMRDGVGDDEKSWLPHSRTALASQHGRLLYSTTSSEAFLLIDFNVNGKLKDRLREKKNTRYTRQTEATAALDSHLKATTNSAFYPTRLAYTIDRG